MIDASQEFSLQLAVPSTADARRAAHPLCHMPHCWVQWRCCWTVKALHCPFLVRVFTDKFHRPHTLWWMS